MKITFKNDICVAMDFVKICSTYKSPIDLCADGHYIVDAKSIMGVSAFAGGYDLKKCNFLLKTNPVTDKVLYLFIPCDKIKSRF